MDILNKSNKNKKKIIAIIQSRLGSLRLQNKALIKIGNKTVLTFLIDRLSKSKFIDDIVIAIPKNKKNIELKNYIKHKKYKFYEGKEYDVLDRFFRTAKTFKGDIIIRITADCPFHDPKLIDEAIKIYNNSKVDILTNYNPPSYPDGYDFSIINFNSLKIANKVAKKSYDREHVVPFIINSKKFKKINIRSRKNLSNLRLTLDEQRDYELLVKIFNKIKNYYFSFEDIVKLHKKNKKIFDHNKNIDRDLGSKISDGQKLWIKAKNLIPSGNMLFSKNSERLLPGLWPSYYSKAKGINIWDMSGKKYTDMSLMSVGTNVLGYSNTIIDKAVKKAISKGNMSTLNCPEEVELAEKLISIHPWAQMVKFTRSGGEANAVAIRIARSFTKKDGVAVCGYHGWHDWYLAANLQNKKILNNHLINNLKIDGVPKSLKKTIFTFNYNNFEELRNLINKNKNIGTVKMEVIRNMEPKKKFLQNIRKLCDEKNLILIFDECTSGFRETYGGIHKKYKINPDMAIFGKAIGNGYPINAIIGKKDLMLASNSSFISSTFWTERLGPVAALKTLEIMKKEKSWVTIKNNGKYIKRKWRALIKKYKISAKISGLDSMPKFTFNSKYRMILKTYVTQEMLKLGYLVDEAIYLSTKHNKKNLNKYLKSFEKVLSEINLIKKIKNIKKKCLGNIAIDNFKRFN